MKNGFVTVALADNFSHQVMHILENSAPGLSEQLGNLPIEIWRRVLINACVFAASQIKDLEPELQDILKTAERSNALSHTQKEVVTSYAESTDNRYMDLKDEGDEENSLNWFVKARLATALANIFGGSSPEDAADAAYELTAIYDNPAVIIELIRAECRKSGG